MVPRREARSRTAMLVSRSSYKISMSVGVEVKVPINVLTKIKHYNTMLADSQRIGTNIFQAQPQGYHRLH